MAPLSGVPHGLYGLLILTLLAYARVWAFGWVYDDPNWLPAPALSSWRLWPRLPFAVAEWIGGGLPWAYHGLILGLHLLNGALLWGLARRWLSPVAALLTLTLFWLHPIQVGSVAYVSGGMEVLLGTYVLLAITGGLRASRVAQSLGALMVLAAAVLKLSALPVLVIVPVVLACLQHYSQGRIGLAVLVGGLLVGWPAVRSWGVTSSVQPVNELAIASWHYLAGVLWPIRFAPEQDWPGSMLASLAALAVGLLAWRCKGRWAAPWWAWAWIVAWVLPRALIRHEASPLMVHHTYVPFLAVWLLAGSALDRFVLKESYA